MLGCKSPTEPIPVIIEFRVAEFDSVSNKKVVSGTKLTLSFIVENPEYIKINDINLDINSRRMTINPSQTLSFTLSISSTVSSTITVEVVENGTVGSYYQGGIIFHIERDSCLISAMQDLPPATWEDAIINCRNAIINETTEWKLANIEELEILWKQQNLVGGFLKYWNPANPKADLYWSSTDGHDPEHLTARVIFWLTPPD